MEGLNSWVRRMSWDTEYLISRYRITDFIKIGAQLTEVGQMV